ncbi:Bdr family repetitive protein [Borreliella afzelii]|uniref:Bdr family repetitive protein n=1 Tax=Borreliella afzelii TaxID=29518 RepID=UPI00359C5B4F
MKVALTTNTTEEQIYKEFLRLGMEQLIAQDLSKRYYHNVLTYRDLENLEKQFGIKFDNLVYKIDTVEKTLQKDIANLAQDFKKNIVNLAQDLGKKLQINNQLLLEKMEINNQLLLEKLKASNRIITIVAIVVVPTVISVLAPFVMSLITKFFK